MLVGGEVGYLASGGFFAGTDHVAVVIEGGLIRQQGAGVGEIAFALPG